MTEPKQQRVCPKCSVEMAAGTRTDGRGTASEYWFPWSGRGLVAWVRSFTTAVPVITFACPRCGLLESYLAPDQDLE